MDKIIWLGSYNPRGFCNGHIVGKEGISPTQCNFKGAGTAVTVNDENLTFDERQKAVNEFLKLRRAKKLMESKSKLRIRRLTPKECWRLMGFDDSDFEKASKVNSDNQLYKQAGNSIVVNCLEEIFKNLLF